MILDVFVIYRDARARPMPEVEVSRIPSTLAGQHIVIGFYQGAGMDIRVD